MGRKHILVVDDDAITRQLLQAALQQGGFRVSLAGDAVEARRLLDWHASQVSVNLVLTDFSMPGMTGLELLDILKITHPGLPVGMISGEWDEGLRQNALTKGCAFFLQKPFALEVLSRLVREILRTPPLCGAAQYVQP